MKSKLGQHGITFTGFLVVCGFIGILAILVIKLFPLYYESIKVYSAMKSIAATPDIASKGKQEIQKLMLRRFEVDDVDQFNQRNMQAHLKIKNNKTGKNRLMTMIYESRRPFIHDLDVVYKFNKTIELAGVEGE